MKKVRLSDVILRHSKLFLLLNILLTVFFAFYAVNLRIHDDIMNNYLPKNHPEVVFHDEVGEIFQGNDAGIVIIEADDVFSLPVLETIAQLTAEFKKIDQVASVTSLTNSMDMRSEGDAMVVEDLVRDELDYTEEELQELKEYTLSKELYEGNLVSSDGRYSMIILKLSPEADSGLVSAAARKVVETYGGEYKYHFTGMPFVSADGDTSAKNDLKVFLPIVILVVLTVLYLSFHSLRGVILPMVAVLCSVVWTMGLLTMLGKELSTVGSTIPVILIAVGSAYGIHVMNEYNSSVSGEANKMKQFADGLNDITKPVILSAFTTIAGFISLRTSDLTPIRDFGVFTAFGVFAALVTAYTFIPALLIHLPYRPHKQTVQTRQSKVAKSFSRWLLGSRNQILAAFIVLTVLCIALIPRLNFDTDYAAAFRPNSATRKALDLVAEKFGGGSILNIYFEGDLQNPFVLRQMKWISDEAKKVGANKPLSYARLIEEANDVINGSKRIPDTHDKIASLGLFLEGQDQLADYVTSDYTKGLLVFRMPETSAAEMKKVTDAVAKILAQVPTTYYTVDKSKVADPEFLTYLNSVQLEVVSEAVQQLVPGVSQEEIANHLQKLLHFDRAQYLADNPEEIDEFLDEALCEDYAGFPVSGGDQLKQEIHTAVEEGADVDQIAEILSRYNPEIDSADLEDLAAYILEDLEFLLMDAKYAALNNAAEEIAAAGSASSDAVAGILKGLWDTELNLAAIPDQYQDSPAVQQHSFTLKMTGAPVLFQILTEMLTSSQYKSLGMSILLVLVLLIIQLGSLQLGLIAITPIILTVIINFGIMAVAGIPLDAATTMIASIAIGIGIDYAIHFINRFRLEQKRNDSYEEVLETTFTKAGKAIISNALSVALGFFVLVMSSTVTVAYFGGLTALTMLVSALTALVLLPCLLLIKTHKNKVQKGESFNA